MNKHSPLEPMLPPAPPPLASEPADEVIARYGQRGATLMKGMTAIAESIQTAAERLVDNSKASLEAAQGMLRLLEEEQALFSTELKRYSDGMAARITHYMTRCESASRRMREEREAFIATAQELTADPPPMSLVVAEDEEAHR